MASRRTPEAERRAAREALASWARSQARRDDLIRRAVAAGLSWTEIQAASGIARTTIARVVSVSRSRSDGPRGGSDGPEGS